MVIHADPMATIRPVYQTRRSTEGESWLSPLVSMVTPPEPGTFPGRRNLIPVSVGRRLGRATILSVGRSRQRPTRVWAGAVSPVRLPAHPHPVSETWDGPPPSLQGITGVSAPRLAPSPYPPLPPPDPASPDRPKSVMIPMRRVIGACRW
jgi:hypothetical protein